MSTLESTEQERVLASDWGGGRSPLRAHHGKLGMWLFLASDALTFGGLLVGYLVLRAASPTWPRVLADHVFSIELVSLMTFILICSSAVMALAVSAAQRGDAAGVRRFLLLTILGGTVFLGMQVYEWSHFIHAGATLAGNPYGPPLFGASFFVITGIHGSHVLSGVIYLSVLATKALRGKFSGEAIENAGLYWHFVDLVWVFVFTLFYLI